MPKHLLKYVVFLIITISTFPVQAQEYLWPTDSGYFLSSTFGETRSAHFHAGLDIKTWGREGYQVFATRNGKIHRLLITERGYGKAVYLKHPDGNYSVYAHLQRFNDEIQAYVDSIRMLDYSFEVDLTVDSLNWEVEQGEVIGFTGSTGIGPPHLHFELRDSLENPYNALTTNLTVEDNLSPIINSLIVEPIHKNSRVEGDPYSKTIPVKTRNNPSYDFGEISVFGKVGLAVNVYDMADKVYNKYAVYTLSLLHGRDTLFHQQLDTFSYLDDNSPMPLDRIAPFGSTNRGHHRLYSKDRSNIPFHIETSHSPIIEPTDSAKTYTIVASDYFGNTSTATVTIKKGITPEPGVPSYGNSTESWYWTENWASPDLEHTIDLVNITKGFPWNIHQRMLYLGGSNPTNFTRVIPGKSHLVHSHDYRLQLRFGPNNFFDTLTVASTYSVENDDAYISIQPKMIPSKTDFKLEFYLADIFESENKYRLFSVNKKTGRLKYVDSELRGRTIHAWVSNLGEYVIKADNTAPQIYNFRIQKTDYGQWQGLVSVNDALSGIDSETAEFWINGQRGIAEYDYEEQLLIYYLPDFIPQNHNTALIRIKDNAGNLRSVSYTK